MKGEVVEAFEAEGTISLDSSIDGAVPIIEMIADERIVDAMDALAAAEQDISVREALAKLDDRRRGLIESRYGVDRSEQSSLAQIGRSSALTRERVRQLEWRSSAPVAYAR
jgi:DNA-directed RNA polymerase sigma subunit (sigma70/sigma32)